MVRTVTAVPSVALRALSAHAIDEERLSDLICSFSEEILHLPKIQTFHLEKVERRPRAAFCIRQRP
jgi:hypothetical protein